MRKPAKKRPGNVIDMPNQESREAAPEAPAETPAPAPVTKQTTPGLDASIKIRRILQSSIVTSCSADAWNRLMNTIDNELFLHAPVATKEEIEKANASATS